MKKKNSRKRSYKSTLLILLLTAILLIVSTYAWFTSNRTVTVNSINVNVEAVNGLQISTDAAAWKTIISNDDIITKAYNGNVNQVPSILKPCSTDKSTDASTGYMNMYYGEVLVDEDDGGAYKLTTSLQSDKKESGETATGLYVAFDIFLRVDEDSPVYLTTNSGVSSTDTASRGLENAARIAFVKEGHVAVGGSATGLKEASKVILWEPNNNAHTAAAIANAKDTYGQSAFNASTVVNSYYGVNSAFEKVALTDESSEHFTQITPDIKTGTTMTAYQKFDDLEAGITKYRVYMWVEGQDYDCENNASGANIKYDLQFSLDSAAI